LTEAAPTPLVTYATAILGSAYGLVFTASHNPPEWNGLKVFHSDGSLLLDPETRLIEAETNALTPSDIVKLELDLALSAGVVERRDFTNQYVDAVEALIDLEAIRKAGLKVIVDPMYGVGQLTLGTLLTEARWGSMYTWAGATRYRLRERDGRIRLVEKKVLLVNNADDITTMAFLI